MGRLRLLWHRVKWPLLWASIPLLVYVVGYHLWIDHKNLHLLVEWAERTDRELAALKPKPPSQGVPK